MMIDFLLRAASRDLDSALLSWQLAARPCLSTNTVVVISPRARHGRFRAYRSQRRQEMVL